MPQEMTFAQALNEAKGVIVQLSNRVKSDAEKIRTQQQTIVAQSATLTAHEERLKQQDEQLAAQADQIATMSARLRELETAREAADAMVNRQGEKIGALEATNQDLIHQIADREERIATLIQERDLVKAQLPSEEDTAALASMSALLLKAGPVIDKVKKTNSSPMRLADDIQAQAA